MCDGLAEMMMMFNTIMASGYRIIAGERRWAIAIVDVDAYFYDSERLRIDSSVRKSSSTNPTFVGGHPLHKMTARQRGAADRTHAWSGPGLATDDDCDDGEEVSWVGCTENIDLHYTSNTIGILSVNIEVGPISNTSDQSQRENTGLYQKTARRHNRGGVNTVRHRDLGTR